MISGKENYFIVLPHDTIKWKKLQNWTIYRMVGQRRMREYVATLCQRKNWWQNEWRRQNKMIAKLFKKHMESKAEKERYDTDQRWSNDSWREETGLVVVLDHVREAYLQPCTNE